MKSSARNISQIALMACLITICAQITLPFFGVPMTLQTFSIALCGYILGIGNSLFTVMIYLALGSIGIPVFAGFGGSFAFLLGPTGGFLFGFLPFVFFCSLASHIKSYIKIFSLSMIGLLFCHLLGILWFAYVNQNSIFTAFLLTSAPFLFKDMLSFVFAYFLTIKIRQRAPHLFLFHT